MTLPRFSLRTLLVLVAIIGVLLGCIVRQINWIRQRYEAAAKHEMLVRRQETIDQFAMARQRAPWLGPGYLDSGVAKKNARHQREIIRQFGSGQNVIYDDDHVETLPHAGRSRPFAVISDAPAPPSKNDDIFKSNEPSP